MSEDSPIRTTNVLGIGFGPANLSTAIAAQDHGLLEHCHFLERADGFHWQRDQMIDGTDIQNNPFRDLVMPRDPRHRYTFVNYLHQHGKLTRYLHYNSKFALRNEYADYLQWVASQFKSHVTYGQNITHIDVSRYNGEQWFEVASGAQVWRAKHLILGTGRSCNIPAPFSGSEPRVSHASHYLPVIDQLDRDRKHTVAVVGASQSAIEIILDLLSRPNIDRVVSIQRGLGFRLKDTSSFSRQVFLPEFVDYFHPLPLEAKARIRQQLRTVNYGACDQDVIDQLTTLQRQFERNNLDRFALMPFSTVTAASSTSRGTELTVTDVNTGGTSSLDAHLVILATGYRDFGAGAEDERCHPLLSRLAHRIRRETDGTPIVRRDYSVDLDTGDDRLSVYLNGLCEASHGMGDAGALAVLSARADDIAASLRARLSPGSKNVAAATPALAAAAS